MTDDRRSDAIAVREEGELASDGRGDFLGDMAEIAGDATLATAALLGGPIGGFGAIGLRVGWKVLESKFGRGAGRRAQEARRERFERELDQELERVRALLEEQGEVLGEHEEKLSRFATFVHTMMGPAFMATDEFKVRWIARAIANATVLDGVKASGAAALVREVGEMEPFDLRILAQLSGGRVRTTNDVASESGASGIVVALGVGRLAQRGLLTLPDIESKIETTAEQWRAEIASGDYARVHCRKVVLTRLGEEIVELCTRESL